MEKTKVYICGKMTGMPDFNYPYFNKKANELRLAGYKVYNPAEVDSDDSFEWEDYMREAVKMLLECDILYVLDGYESSKGANVEIDLAKILNIRVVTESGKILNKGRDINAEKFME